MPKDFLGFLVGKVEQLEAAALFEDAEEIPELAVDARDDRLVGERLADGLGDGEGGGLPGCARAHGAVAQRHLDVDLLAGCHVRGLEMDK